jgi:flavin-dependent dehydrogenase
VTAERYDVVVVGARCAGAPTAMLLAERYRVLLLDRARLPSDTLSTHYIHPPGLALLARWGLLDALAATGCPRIERITHQVDDVRLAAPVPSADGVGFAYAPRRHLLDAVLVDAAVAAGVQLRDGCEVVDLRFDGDTAAITHRSAGGAPVTVHARLVVGADGMRSTVARLAGARVEREDPPLTCAYYTYWAGVEAGFELYERAGRLVGTLPTNDDQTLVAAYFPSAEFPAVRQDALGAYLTSLRGTAPELADRLTAGERTERLRGTGEQRNFFRQAYGDGWVLVGDAGHHKDSVTARGIIDAFEQAAMLADGIADELHDARRLRASLQAFAARRAARFEPLYRTALLAAALEVTPQRLGTLRFLSSRPDLVDRYFAVGAGMLAAEELYTQELFAELMAYRAEPAR